MRLSLIFISLLSACASSAPGPMTRFGATFEVEVSGRIAVFTLRVSNKGDSAWRCTGAPSGAERGGRPSHAGIARIGRWRFSIDGVDEDVDAWVGCLTCEAILLDEVPILPGEYARAVYSVSRADCASQVGVMIQAGGEQHLVWSDNLGPHLRRAAQLHDAVLMTLRVAAERDRRWPDACQ